MSFNLLFHVVNHGLFCLGLDPYKSALVAGIQATLIDYSDVLSFLEKEVYADDLEPITKLLAVLRVSCITT